MISIFMTYCFVDIYIIMQEKILVFSEYNLYQYYILASVWLHCVDIYENIPSLM